MLKAYVDYGDHVRCSNCEAEMLVPIGASICPNCGHSGTLAWVAEDEDGKEADIDQLNQEYEDCELSSDYIPNGKSEFMVEICAHHIKCIYDDDIPCDELPESEEEHIRECLNDGYAQGELCYVDKYDITHNGWWNIEK